MRPPPVHFLSHAPNSPNPSSLKSIFKNKISIHFFSQAQRPRAWLTPPRVPGLGVDPAAMVAAVAAPRPSLPNSDELDDCAAGGILVGGEKPAEVLSLRTNLENWFLNEVVLLRDKNNNNNNDTVVDNRGRWNDFVVLSLFHVLFHLQYRLYSSSSGGTYSSRRDL